MVSEAGLVQSDVGMKEAGVFECWQVAFGGVHLVCGSRRGEHYVEMLHWLHTACGPAVSVFVRVLGLTSDLKPEDRPSVQVSPSLSCSN